MDAKNSITAAYAENRVSEQHADLSARLKAAAEAVMKAEPLHGIVGVHGEQDVWAEVDEAYTLAAAVLDEVLPLLAERRSAPCPQDCDCTADCERLSPARSEERRAGE